MAATATRTNKFAADCARCARHVAASAGRLIREDGSWLVLCADAETCADTQEQRVRAAEIDAAKLEELVQAEGARRIAAGENPDYWDVLADVQAKLASERGVTPAPAKKATTTTRRAAGRRTATSRRQWACVTGGNCSSHSGRNCGGYDCDAN